MSLQDRACAQLVLDSRGEVAPVDATPVDATHGIDADLRARPRRSPRLPESQDVPRFAFGSPVSSITSSSPQKKARGRDPA